MSISTWFHTPWYLRIFGWSAYRRQTSFGWEYYNEAVHGRGLWVK